MVRKILITGGNGFIGLKLINYIIKKNKNYHIRIIDNLSTSKIDEIKKLNFFIKFNSFKKLKSNKRGIFFCKADILNKNVVSDALKDIDIVVHLAANAGVAKSISDPIFDMANNILGTLNILESVQKNKIKKFIFSSSNAVIGKTNKRINEKTDKSPTNPYGVSKLSCETYINTFSELYKIPSIILRFGNVYGPGSINKTSIIPKFIKKIQKKEICFIYGDGNQTRDFIYIDDLINAIYKSIDLKLKNCEIFQISNGKQTSVKEISEIISNQFFNILKIKPIFKYSKERIGDVKKNYSSIKKANNILKWYPKVDLEDGIKKTITFFLDVKKL